MPRPVFFLLLFVYIIHWSLFFASRLLYCTLVESLMFFEPFPGFFLFNGLLLVLQLLHVYWAYLILRMLHKFIFLGKVRRPKR